MKGICCLTWILTFGVMSTVIWRFYLTRLETIEYRFLLMVTVFLIFMTLWCHYVCANTDPGYIKQNQKHLKQDNEDINGEVISLCEKCNVVKSDEIHHCSNCKRCVYKMDHHCAWINNCVGYFTIKSFLLFNFYLSLLTFIGTSVVLMNILREVKIADEK